jgi:heme/copper-type cytochrome/quinol oxidase subunit 2
MKNEFRRLIFLSLLCAVICCAEFIFHFLPRAAETDSAVFWNGVFIRLALLALLALIVIVSLLFEYVIRNAENAERKPFVTEYKRIGY